MRYADEADRENIHFTYKPTTLPDGRVKLVSPQAPGKEWFGADLTEALRKADRAVQDMKGTQELSEIDKPQWMKESARFRGDR